MLTALLDTEITEITPTRNLNLLYIILDCIFLVVLLAMLIWQKRWQTFIFAIFGGVLYTIVDFGGFYLLSHTRTVLLYGEVAGMLDTFWVLLWMSMSYGITNFIFIWSCLGRDKLRKYWIFLIVMWWLICPSISELGGEAFITTTRTTGAYHGWMGVVMVVSYLILAILLIWKKKPFVSILELFAIGFFVQFGWEFSLLINGIRPMNAMSIETLVVNSCLETNLGMPAAYLIFWFVRKFRNEDMSRVQRTPSGGKGGTYAGNNDTDDAKAAAGAGAGAFSGTAGTIVDSGMSFAGLWAKICAFFSGSTADASQAAVTASEATAAVAVTTSATVCKSADIASAGTDGIITDGIITDGMDGTVMNTVMDTGANASPDTSPDESPDESPHV